MAGLLASACRDPEDPPGLFIGPEGGLVVSEDRVLTIAIQPDALSEPIQIWIEPTDAPPESLGPAYEVLPTVTLERPATITYRNILPPDTSGITVGFIDPDDFAAGQGYWRALPLLSVDPDVPLVRATDDRLSPYYGLVDNVPP